MSFSSTLIAIVILGSVSADDLLTSNDCWHQDFGKGTPGFLANFYQYNLRSTDGWTDGFFESPLYADTSVLYSVPLVISSNFRFEAENEKVVWGNIYGSHMSISNYSIELTGYFTPNISGLYNFTLKADNGASLLITLLNKYCEIDEGLEEVSRNVTVLDNYNGGGKIDLIKTLVTIGLQKDLVYFARIKAFNWQGNGGLDVSFTTPNCEKIEDLGSVIFQKGFKDAGKSLSSVSIPSDFTRVNLSHHIPMKSSVVLTMVEPAGYSSLTNLPIFLHSAEPTERQNRSLVIEDPTMKGFSNFTSAPFTEYSSFALSFESSWDPEGEMVEIDGSISKNARQTPALPSVSSTRLESVPHTEQYVTYFSFTTMVPARPKMVSDVTKSYLSSLQIEKINRTFTSPYISFGTTLNTSELSSCPTLNYTWTLSMESFVNGSKARHSALSEVRNIGVFFAFVFFISMIN